MRAIAYVSSASRDLLDEDLEAIVAESRGRNLASGITGVLLYCDGNFMQYIEGPDDAVAETWERILRSEHHYQVSELMNEAIERREFGDWTMGFSRLGPETFIASPREPGPEHAGPGAALLRLFWANCRTKPA